MNTALSRGLSGLPGRGKDLKVGFRLQVAWPRIVGEMMSRYLFPVDVSGDRLTIGVTSAVWMQEAEYQRDTLLSNIAVEVGGGCIRQLQFRMLPVPPVTPARPPPGPPRAPELTPRPLEPDEEAHLAAELERIADPALRDQLRRILEKSLRRYPRS